MSVIGPIETKFEKSKKTNLGITTAEPVHYQALNQKKTRLFLFRYK